jgi:hypothetical protein
MLSQAWGDVIACTSNTGLFKVFNSTCAVAAVQ